MQFSPDLRDRVADGTVTVSYRLWSRPKVKVGGVYRSGSVTIEIDDIELLPFSSITDEDLARPERTTSRPFVAALHTRVRSAMTPCSTASSSMSRASRMTTTGDLNRRVSAGPGLVLR